DGSTWLHAVCCAFRHNHAGAGRNPELRTLFYRLASFLNIPVHAIFVFDGPSRPHVKRNKQVRAIPHWLATIFQEMLAVFGFAKYEAPGEAEAELAALTRHGIIDAVLTTDIDAIVFGATCVIRYPEPPGHFDRVGVYTDHVIASAAGMSHEDLVLIAILSGGDYDVSSIPHCGIKIARGVSQYKLGQVLIRAFSTKSQREFVDFCHDWRKDLRRVLTTDPEGYLGRVYPAVANSITDSFPDCDILQKYIHPITTFSSHSGTQDVATTMTSQGGSGYHTRSLQPSLKMLASFCKNHFGWDGDAAMAKMRATVWEGAELRLLCGVSMSCRFEQSNR
ncbi:PIN domain-like protein, partial [Boletus edulis BED1]